jgi:hypothetical protein
MGGRNSKEGEFKRGRREDDEETVYDGADDALFLPPCCGAIAFLILLGLPERQAEEGGSLRLTHRWMGSSWGTDGIVSNFSRIWRSIWTRQTRVR